MCDSGGDLELGRSYGAMTLTSFTTRQNGQQSLSAEIQISYTITNSGMVDAIVQSAIVRSFFSGPSQERFPTPEKIPRNGRISLEPDRQVLDLREASQLPSYLFGLELRGKADTQAGLSCEPEPAVLFFSVAGAPQR